MVQHPSGHFEYDSMQHYLPIDLDDGQTTSTHRTNGYQQLQDHKITTVMADPYLHEPHHLIQSNSAPRNTLVEVHTSYDRGTIGIQTSPKSQHMVKREYYPRSVTGAESTHHYPSRQRERTTVASPVGTSRHTWFPEPVQHQGPSQNRYSHVQTALVPRSVPPNKLAIESDVGASERRHDHHVRASSRSCPTRDRFGEPQDGTTNRRMRDSGVANGRCRVGEPNEHLGEPLGHRRPPKQQHHHQQHHHHGQQQEHDYGQQGQQHQHHHQQHHHQQQQQEHDYGQQGQQHQHHHQQHHHQQQQQQHDYGQQGQQQQHQHHHQQQQHDYGQQGQQQHQQQQQHHQQQQQQHDYGQQGQHQHHQQQQNHHQQHHQQEHPRGYGQQGLQHSHGDHGSPLASYRSDDGYVSSPRRSIPNRFQSQSIRSEASACRRPHRDRSELGSKTARVYFGNVAHSLTQKNLERIASKYGEVADVSFKKGTNNNLFGFATYLQKSDAIRAIQELDGKIIAGRALRVELTIDREGKKPRQEKTGPARKTTETKDADVRYKWRVMVEGIPTGANWQDLKDHFRPYGNVAYANVNLGGVGVVEFSDEGSLSNAIVNCDGSLMIGSSLPHIRSQLTVYRSIEDGTELSPPEAEAFLDREVPSKHRLSLGFGGIDHLPLRRGEVESSGMRRCYDSNGLGLRRVDESDIEIRASDRRNGKQNQDHDRAYSTSSHHHPNHVQYNHPSVKLRDHYALPASPQPSSWRGLDISRAKPPSCLFQQTQNEPVHYPAQQGALAEPQERADGFPRQRPYRIDNVDPYNN